MNSLTRLCSTREYRGLSKVEKALKLVENNEGGVREALAATGTSAPQYYRAKRAREENRSIGVHGRPILLGDEGEALLIEAIDEGREKKDPLEYQEIKQKVKLHPSNTLHSFTQFSLYKHPNKHAH